MDEPAGWFGKLPCCGDFVARRLDAELVGLLDAWLSRSMRVARERRGDDWLRGYLAARVVSFAWGPGVVDEQCWCGVLMPSCDNVGRYFPLIVLQACAAFPHDADERARLRSWHARHGAAALHVLDDDVSLDEFERDLLVAAVREAASQNVAPEGEPLHWWRALDGDPAGRTAWWFQDEADADGELVIHAELPDPEAFMRLFAEARDGSLSTDGG